VFIHSHPAPNAQNGLSAGDEAVWQDYQVPFVVVNMGYNIQDSTADVKNSSGAEQHFGAMDLIKMQP